MVETFLFFELRSKTAKRLTSDPQFRRAIQTGPGRYGTLAKHEVSKQEVLYVMAGVPGLLPKYA